MPDRHFLRCLPFLVLAACAPPEHESVRDDVHEGAEGGLDGDIVGLPDADELDDADEVDGAPLVDSGNTDTPTGAEDASDGTSMDAASDGAVSDSSFPADSRAEPTDASLPEVTVVDAAMDADTSVDASLLDGSPEDPGGPPVAWVPRPSNLPCGALGNLSDRASPLVDLGHGDAITYIAQDGERVVSLDMNRRWVLWDHATRTMLAAGKSTATSQTDPRYPVLKGGLLVVGGSSSLQVRAANDGRLLREIATANAGLRHGVATDGSYVWHQANDGVKAWTPRGNLVASSGVAATEVFAAPGELRLAERVVGNRGRVTILSTLSGAVRSVELPDVPTVWSEDGTFLLARDWSSNEVVVRRPDSFEVVTTAPWQLPTPSNDRAPTLQSFGGRGDRFWRLADSDLTWFVDVYSSLNAAAPLAHLEFAKAHPLASADILAPVWRNNSLSIFNLAYGWVRTIDFSLPGSPVRLAQLVSSPDSLGRPVVHAASSTDAWLVGYDRGTIVEGEDGSRVFSCGRTKSIAGSDNGRTVIATPGGVLLFSLTPESRAYTAGLPLTGAIHAEMSNDGLVLATSSTLTAPAGEPDTIVKAFLLPSLRQLRTWPIRMYGATTGDDASWFPRHGFKLSPDGRRIGVAGAITLPDTGAPGVRKEVFVIAQDAPVLRVDREERFAQVPHSGVYAKTRMLFSPDGTFVVMVDGEVWNRNVVTFPYQNGSPLLSWGSSYALGWTADGAVLVVDTYPSSSGGFSADYLLREPYAGHDVTLEPFACMTAQATPFDLTYLAPDVYTCAYPTSFGIYQGIERLWRRTNLVAAGRTSSFAVYSESGSPFEVHAEGWSMKPSNPDAGAVQDAGTGAGPAEDLALAVECNCYMLGEKVGPSIEFVTEDHIVCATNAICGNPRPTCEAVCSQKGDTWSVNRVRCVSHPSCLAR